jgi:hypothetical protein
MSYQDPNQPYGAPQQQQGQQGQPGQGQSGGWGQQSRQQGSWGQPGGEQQQSSGQQQQQQQAWGAPQQGQSQGQIPQQPNYGSAPSFGGQGQSGPQDYPPQQFNQPQPGYGQGFPGGSQGYAGGSPGFPGGSQGYPGSSQGYAGGSQGFPGGSQGYAGNPQGYPGGPQGFPGGSQGYPPQTDFGSGAGYGPGPGYPMPNQGTSGLATAALWLGILGGWGIINLVVSILAIRETGPGKKPGRNKAVTGLVLTIAWAVVWTGIFVAVSDHAGKDLTPVGAPTIAAPVAGAGSGASTSATGAAGAQATGASSDPGCQAAQTAFNTYSANAESGGLGAIQTLGNALVSAAGESQAASGELKTMGQDYLELANETTPPNMVTDLEALDSACGMSFTFSG